jgi:hypothetical protein
MNDDFDIIGGHNVFVADSRSGSNFGIHFCPKITEIFEFISHPERTKRVATMNSFHLISTTPAVWSGDPLTTVEFRVTLPSNLGVVKSANAVLVLLSSNNQRSERSDDSIRRAKMEAGKQMRMPIDTFEYDHASPPVLIFQNQRISGPFVKSTTNAEQLLCSYLNSSEEYDGGHCLLKTRIDLNNLSTQITGFALQLEFSEQQIMTLDNRHLKPLARSFQERSNVIK